MHTHTHTTPECAQITLFSYFVSLKNEDNSVKIREMDNSNENVIGKKG